MGWFVRSGDNVGGPLTGDEVRDLYRGGQIAKSTPLSPDGTHFYPLEEWREFSERGSRVASQPDAREFFEVPPQGAIHGTRPKLAEGVSEPNDDAFDLIRVQDLDPTEPRVAEATPSTTEIHWVKNQQGNFQSVLSHHSAPVPSAPPNSIGEQKDYPRDSSNHVPSPTVPPVHSGWVSSRWIAVAGASMVLVVVGAFLIDRWIYGARSSDLSEYLPAGGSFYFEIPSMKRLTRSVGKISWIDWGESDAKETFVTTAGKFNRKGASSELKVRLLESASQFAVTMYEGQLLFATKYAEAGVVEEYVALVGDKTQHEAPFVRYFIDDKTECLWWKQERIELCGESRALAAAQRVVEGGAPSAATEAHVVAAKVSSFAEYIPFNNSPFLYAAFSRATFEEHEALDGLQGATTKVGFDSQGLLERLDLIFEPGQAPDLRLAEGSLTHAQDFPETTIAYVAYRSRIPESETELRRFLEPWERSEGASLDEALQEMQDVLGVPLHSLLATFDSEGALGLSVAEGASLEPDPGENPEAALWFSQALKDATALRNVIDHAIEGLPAPGPKIKWIDESNLVCDLPKSLRLHVRLTSDRVLLGVGGRDEVDRGMNSEVRMGEKAAHGLGLSGVADDASLVIWFDAVRLTKLPGNSRYLPWDSGSDSEVLSRSLAKQELNPDRPVIAVGVKQYADGHVRIRSRNFPWTVIPLLLAARAAVSQLSPDLDDAEP